MPPDWSRLETRLGQVDSSITLSMAELADIVGALPASASSHPVWWSGNRAHVLSWRRAGFEARDLQLGSTVTFVRRGEETAMAAPGDSSAQRRAEALMLRLLGNDIGVDLAPRRLTSPSGAYIDVDGVSTDGSVLVECWAHQGSAKVAQKDKLVKDATKLWWAASWCRPTPSRLLLCVSDEEAVKHLRGRSWQGAAIRDLGVEIKVVTLDGVEVEALVEAQRRQFR